MPKAPFNQYEPKTPLARLRHEFLFRPNGKRVFRSQLARELELSTVRIQQLELGQAELPEKHALELQEIYGISAAWLLAGNPKAKPVTPAGTRYSKVIASYRRKVYQVRVTKGDSANLAGNLTLSLEALLSEIRTMIIRENQETDSWRPSHSSLQSVMWLSSRSRRQGRQHRLSRACMMKRLAYL